MAGLEMALNRMAGPSLTEQEQNRNLALAKGYTDVASNLERLGQSRMESDLARKKMDLLRNFEGQTGTSEFQNKMMSVDPELVMKMQKHTQNMDKAERESARDYFDQVAAKALMDDTPEKWQQGGWKVPWEKRNEILKRSMTYKQAFEYQKEMKGGTTSTALMKNIKYLVDNNLASTKEEAKNLLLSSKGKTPDDYYRDLVKSFVTTGYYGEDEAVQKAKAITEKVYETNLGNNGFQSAAGPAGSNPELDAKLRSAWGAPRTGLIQR